MSKSIRDLDNMTDEEFEAYMRDMESSTNDDVESQVEENQEIEETTNEEVEEETTSEEEPSIEQEDEELDDSEEQKENTTTTTEETDGTSNEEKLPSIEWDNIKEQFIPIEIKANKQKLKLTFNEAVELAKKGLNYTQKMQELAPKRRMIATMDQYGLSEEDINLLIEAKQGKKEAIAKLLGDSNLDITDIDPEEAKDYKPDTYQINETQFQMKEIVDTITNDDEYETKIQPIINQIPDDMYQAITSNPQMLQGFYQDIKEGIVDRILPELVKQKALNPTMDSLTIYKNVFQQLQTKPIVEQSTKKLKEIKKTKAMNEKRKQAAIKQPSKSQPKYVNYDDLDDEEFAKLYEEVIGRPL